MGRVEGCPEWLVIEASSTVPPRLLQPAGADARRWYHVWGIPEWRKVPTMERLFPKPEPEFVCCS